ncbi:anillin-like [Rhopilema esculentum]|uniref:anillin-like n=1 Tax=Rhopilema esculentum TaxID=499914 RepID=UPI0031DD6E58
MFESDQSINAKFKAAEIQFECETVVLNTQTNLIRGACVGDILKYSEGNLTKMDDFTQEEKLKMSEENLWLVHGREDVSYKSQWAQRRLLEKKNARKRKQEEASAALRSIDIQSNAKKSPTKLRHPLSPKNDNDPVGAKLPPVAKPRTDRGSEKKSTPHRRNYREGRSPGKDLEEILDSGRKSQIFTSSRNEMSDAKKHGKQNNDVNVEDISVQERMSKFSSQSRANSCERKDVTSRGSTSRDSKGKSGSISDRLAIFETSSKANESRSYASPNKSSDTKATRKSHRSEEEKSASRSPSKRLSTKLQKTSTMKEPGNNRSEVKTPLTPQLEAINNGDVSCDFDYNSDENPFDISSILRAANEGEAQVPSAVEYNKASWDVMDYLTGDSPQVNENKQGQKRDSVYSNYGADEDMSGFAKEIAKKRKAIKSPYQEQSLKKIDSNLNAKTRDLVREELPKAKNVEAKAAEVKPREEKKVTQDRKTVEQKQNIQNGSRLKSEASQKQHRHAKEERMQLEQKEAPPKPPRKGKESFENNQQDVNMIDSVETFEHQNTNESVRGEDKRKRGRDGENAAVVLDTEKASSGHRDGAYSIREKHEENDSKKLKQSKKAIVSDSGPYSCQLPDVKEDSSSAESANEVIFSPNSQAYKSVREKKVSKGRKGMRRSMSFSEGQSPIIPVIHKSGYNEEMSSKYNVVTSCTPSGEGEEKSISDQIKDLLDYGVSQQNIVIQTSQALNLSLNGEERKGCPEIIEGERLLLLATQRRTACLDEVERLKQPGSHRSKKTANKACLPCKAALVISDIKLPLNADFLVALRGGRMDLGVFHFVVLIQHGPTQIYSTKVRCTYDELTRNFITFNDRIVLKDVPHDFVLNIKVFGMHTKRASDVVSRGKKSQQSKESPGLIKNMFSSLTPKKRLNSGDDSPVRGSSPKPVFRSTNFTSVGNVSLNLSTISSGRFVLNQVPKNCPLDGFVELNVDCLPEFTASARGFLTILEEVGGFTAWNRRWCVMNGDLISFWRFPDEEEQKPPTATINLQYCSNQLVDVVPRMDCSRPNTFELMIKRPLTKNDIPSLLSTVEGKELHTKYWVSADNKEDRVAWIEVLNRQLSDSKAWSSRQRPKVRNGNNNHERAKDSNASPRKQHRVVAV